MRSTSASAGLSPQTLKPRPGTYALVLSAPSRQLVHIGRLGHVQLQPGFYVYVGSAFGPGGVCARVAHHLRTANRSHWHIDYLRAVTQLEEVWYSYDALLREHQWGKVLKHAHRVSTPISKFGASDCKCETHLYFFSVYPSRAAFRRRLRTVCGEHAPVYGTRIEA